MITTTTTINPGPFTCLSCRTRSDRDMLLGLDAANIEPIHTGPHAGIYLNIYSWEILHMLKGFEQLTNT